MAIQIDLTASQFGVPFTSAYFRVATVSLSKQRDAYFSVMIDIVGYATKPINDNTRDIEFRRYHCSLEEIEMQSGENILTKVYNWISSQEDMIGSIGV